PTREHRRGPTPQGPRPPAPGHRRRSTPAAGPRPAGRPRRGGTPSGGPRPARGPRPGAGRLRRSPGPDRGRDRRADRPDPGDLPGDPAGVGGVPGLPRRLVVAALRGDPGRRRDDEATEGPWTREPSLTASAADRSPRPS